MDTSPDATVTLANTSVFAADSGGPRLGPRPPRSHRPILRQALSARERRAEDFDYLEDMLYTAALRAGWLAGAAQREAAAELPDVDILIGITRRVP